MKTFTIHCFLLFLFCQAVAAQSLAVNSTDPVTGARTIITRNSKGVDVGASDNVARNGMLFFSAGYESHKAGDKLVELYFIDLNIIHNDNRLGCLKLETGKMILTFEDGTTAECMQVSETSCDKLAFEGGWVLMPRSGATTAAMQQTLNKLLTVNLKTIEVFTTETSIKFPIKAKEMPYIKSHFALLDKTIKQSKAAQAQTSN